MSHDRNSSTDGNAASGFALDNPIELEAGGKKPRSRKSAPKSYRCPHTIDWVEMLMEGGAPKDGR